MMVAKQARSCFFPKSFSHALSFHIQSIEFSGTYVREKCSLGFRVLLYVGTGLVVVLYHLPHWHATHLIQPVKVMWRLQQKDAQRFWQNCKRALDASFYVYCKYLKVMSTTQLGNTFSLCHHVHLLFLSEVIVWQYKSARIREKKAAASTTPVGARRPPATPQQGALLECMVTVKQNPCSK